VSKLPVLMYHNLCSEASSSLGLTLFRDKFEKQMYYLLQKKYTFFFASEILHLKVLPKKSILITFDDVTENQLEFAIPILKKYHIKATFFIPFGLVGKSDLWNKSDDYVPIKIMSVNQLKSLESSLIEFGHHTFSHKKFTKLTNNQIDEEFSASYDFIKKNNLNVFESMAYPYGDYPKKGIDKNDFFEILKKNDILMGFRIGNRINKFPLKDKFEIQRIDIRGNCSFLAFKWKIRFGKTLLF
jgi:peptidoglycan/xylan/chitin deacetylase (PgdA/CDA1 family)